LPRRLNLPVEHSAELVKGLGLTARRLDRLTEAASELRECRRLLADGSELYSELRERLVGSPQLRAPCVQGQ
jgi:hypothetical protein